jgi:hypothetical protein
VVCIYGPRSFSHQDEEEQEQADEEVAHFFGKSDAGIAGISITSLIEGAASVPFPRNGSPRNTDKLSTDNQAEEPK